jgi:hypothetical protein
MDGEVAELHASTEESFLRIENLTGQLQALPPPATSTPQVGLGAPLAVSGGVRAGGESHIPQETLSAIRKAQADFQALQQLAFRIGRESKDNEALAKHPDVNDYMQNLRSMKQRLPVLVTDLERAYTRATGIEVVKPKKKKKGPKKIQGLPETEIRERTRRRVADDSRPTRTKAMDLVSAFQEKQLQMQDKQRDLQRTMDGPDWPKEDWPLTTADATNVGDAETMIQGSLQVLNSKLAPLGGLARAHESTDETVFEELAALSEMMAGYVELIDRHVETVKRTQKKKPKRNAGRGTSSNDPGTPSSRQSSQGGSLRDSLLSFGAGSSKEKPFAWIRDQANAGSLPPGTAGAGGVQAAGFALGASGVPSSPLGSSTSHGNPPSYASSGAGLGTSTLGSFGGASALGGGGSFGGLAGGGGGFGGSFGGSTLGNLGSFSDLGTGVNPNAFGTQHASPLGTSRSAWTAATPVYGSDRAIGSPEL